MNNIKVLDCTLRDGGYCNEWKFGATNIRHIVEGLVEADIDIIECGFLNHFASYQSGISIYSSMEQVASIIPQDKENKMFVLMANCDEIDIDKLEERGRDTVDGIRLAFHKKDMKKAMQLCKQIKTKGYEVFVQAMVSLNYSDMEYLQLIKDTNDLKPYAFYIVDSFGVMKWVDLVRMFYLVEHNLDQEIRVGYHSHNNMQLAYSNAQALVDIETTRELILDSSIMGMGRGAGNLNTELFIEYLNSAKGTEYKIKPVLRMIDEIINKFHQENYWGYSLANYLSARHNIHPNYAKYLSDKNTLSIEDMDTIFEQIIPDKQVIFDKHYIEGLYLSYMKKGEANEERLLVLKDSVADKKVMLIAPGKSSEEEKEKIIQYAKKNDVVTISVNFDYKELPVDYIFVSNIRRFNALEETVSSKTIITSNISATNCLLKTNYIELVNCEERVSDNAGLMLIKFLMKLGVKEIALAGFDGYSYANEQNYAKSAMRLSYKKSDLDALNNGLTRVLKEYKKEIDIDFVTTERFIRL